MVETMNKPSKSICQNCGADIAGNYCNECGQKKFEPAEKSVRSIAGHFFEEIFTWDSRFLQSIKYLFIKPGFLTHEYVSGRYMRYVSPLKMFLFTSFVLFLIMIKSDPDQYSALVTDTAEDDFLSEFILEQQSNSESPAELYKDNFNDQFNDNITIYIFVIMFFFSILLKLVYLPKHYFYSEHIVFTLHFFTFVLWCFLLGVALQDLGIIFTFLFLYFIPAVYLLVAIRNVYHKKLWKAAIVSVFMTFCYWMLITFWILGTTMVSAVRAA
jgi:hypothetical protein